MSVTVAPKWNGMYIGKMTEQQAGLIMQIRESEEIANLKNMLLDFPSDLVERSINEERAIRDIIKEENGNLTKYIGELRRYQTVGTAFMYMSPRSILADGCGLGKTAEVAALINYLKYKGQLTRFLMCVETTAISQTQAELIRFTGLNIVVLPAEAQKIRRVIKKTNWNNVDGIIIRHSTLRSDALSQWISLNIGEDGLCRLFNTLFIDESSVIKNDKTKTFDYTKNICNVVPRVHFMNATAFETNLMDIYNQLDIINGSLLPRKYRIEEEFCTFKMGHYWITKEGKPIRKNKRDRVGYKNQSIFKDSLKLCYFGRSIKDVGEELPHIYKVYKVTPTTDMLHAINKGYRYNEILNCPSLVKDVNIQNNRVENPKLNRLCEIIQNEFNESSVMVYCFHREAQYKIAEELKAIGRKPVVLNGETAGDEERKRIQNEFNDGTYDVIITNIKRSLNLQKADACIFYSMETNVAKMEQIRGRIDRHVDDKIKTFIMLLYDKTQEYNYFAETVCNRAKDARDLTIDAKTATDFFREAIEKEELNKN